MQIFCGIILISNVDRKILLVRYKKWYRWFPRWKEDVSMRLKGLCCRLWVMPNYLVSNVKILETRKEDWIKETTYFVWYVNRKKVDIQYGEFVDFGWYSLEEVRNNNNFFSMSVLGELEVLLSKELVLKYNRIPLRSKPWNYKIQWSKHAYSRVAALSYLSRNIKFTNIPNILDVWILDEIEGISNASWKVLHIPKTLSDQSRSILPLLPGLLYKHDKVVLHFPKWCGIGARKIDLYLNILEKFWNYIFYDEDNIIIKRWKHSSVIYDFPFPSFSGTSIALTHAAFLSSKTVLTNISIEPEILFQIEVLKQCGVHIRFLKERCIEIVGIDFSKISNDLNIEIPDDRNVLVTKIILSIICKQEFYHKSKENLYLSPLLLEFEKLWIQYWYDKYSIRIYSQQPTLTPINLLANFYPAVCSDWQPFISLLLLSASGNSTIKDFVFENRYKYINEVSKIVWGFSYAFLDDVLEIVWWLECMSTKEASKIFCLDLRSGAVNVLSCFLSLFNVITIKNIYQINRWYENIVWDVFDILWSNHFSYEYE